MRCYLNPVRSYFSKDSNMKYSFVLVLKHLVGMLKSHIRVPEFKSPVCFQFQLQTNGGSRRWLTNTLGLSPPRSLLFLPILNNSILNIHQTFLFEVSSLFSKVTFLKSRLQPSAHALPTSIIFPYNMCVNNGTSLFINCSIYRMEFLPTYMQWVEWQLTMSTQNL